MSSDKAEKEIQDLQQLFRRSVMKLAMAGKGVHPQLDEKLEQIRQLIREQVDLEKVGTAIESVSDVLVELEGAQSHLEAIYNQADIVEQLIGITKDKSKQALLKEFERNCHQLSTHEFFTQVLDILEQTEDGKKAKLFGWLKGKKSPTETQSNGVLAEIQGKMKLLLNMIVIEHANHHEKQLHSLEEITDFSQLPLAFEQLTDLVINTKQFEQQRIDNFFQQLGQRLSRFHDLLGQASGVQKHGFQQSQTFESGLRNQLALLQSETKDATSLQELSQTVNRGLDGIISVLDNFQEQLTERYSEEKEQVKQLQHQLQQTQHEAEKLQNQLKEEKHKAHTDSLTELPNRLAFNERVALEVARTRRYQHQLSVAIADIDKFKQVNDTYGHATGDKVLQMVATHCSVGLRETDFMARLGGEEFVFLLPDTDINQAVICMEKLRKIVECKILSVNNTNIKVTVSFGLTSLREGESIDLALERADDALYTAKDGGRNRVCVKD